VRVFQILNPKLILSEWFNPLEQNINQQKTGVLGGAGASLNKWGKGHNSALYPNYWGLFHHSSTDLLYFLNHSNDTTRRKYLIR